MKIMGDAAKAVPARAAPLMKVLLEILFMNDPFFSPPPTYPSGGKE
jgi:hypothetical protein